MLIIQTRYNLEEDVWKDVLEGLGRKVRGMVTLIMLMPVPIMLLIIPLLKINAIQPRYNLEEDVV